MSIEKKITKYFTTHSTITGVGESISLGVDFSIDILLRWSKEKNFKPVEGLKILITKI
jgi:hypothetical protein